jgi:hypothetical protein
MAKKYNLIGQRFYYLRVVDLAQPKAYKNGVFQKQWLCKCDCGKEAATSTTLLLKGIKKSCGCQNYQIEPHKNSRLDPKDVSKNVLFRRYQNTAKKKKIDWIIEKIDFLRLIEQNCYYCGIEPNRRFNAYITKTERYVSRNKQRCKSAEIIYNGLDRVSSDKPYVLDNVVSCCTICNFAKNELDFEDFKNWVKRIGARIDEIVFDK